MNETLIIIQARMSSTRMPGKILKPFYADKTILQIQLETIQQYVPNVPIVVATTTNTADDAIADFCTAFGVAFFRGSEEDVLQRFIDCAKHFQAKYVVRICSDNPFLSGEYLQALLESGKNKNADYYSYQNHQDTPAIKTHWGLFAEWVTRNALEKTSELTKEAFYHEHVTNYIYGNPDVFSVALDNAPAEVFKREDLRLTIDTAEDFNMAQQLYEMWDKQSLNSLVQKVDTNQEIIAVMKQGIARFTK